MKFNFAKLCVISVAMLGLPMATFSAYAASASSYVNGIELLVDGGRAQI